MLSSLKKILSPCRTWQSEYQLQRNQDRQDKTIESSRALSEEETMKMRQIFIKLTLAEDICARPVMDDDSRNSFSISIAQQSQRESQGYPTLIHFNV